MNARIFLVVIVATLLLGAGACGGAGVVGGECRSDLLECGGQCIDPMSDQANCGACGAVCGAQQSCVDGACEDVGALINDGGVPSFDAPPDDGGADAASDGDAAAPDAADGADAADGDLPDADPADGGCLPPYDNAEHCGDCDTACPASAPVCSFVADGYRCLSVCEAPTLQCGADCVDPNSNPDHCGRCDNRCPSGICQAGTCVGARAGHVVAVCTSHERVLGGSPQAVLLANAVLLPQTSSVRVLAYTEYADAAARRQVDRALEREAQARGKQLDVTELGLAAGLLEELNTFDYDTLLIYDQPHAPAGSLAQIGALWADSLDAFARAGGTLVVLAGGDTAGFDSEMDALLNAAGLLRVASQPDVSGQILKNSAPADAVGLNVLSSFAADRDTCTFQSALITGPENVYVVTDPRDEPVVIHRISLP